MSESKQPGPLRRAVGQFFLLDLLRDREARYVFIYVSGTILFGTLIYHFLEGWDWVDSLYFVVITTTTIGYGDLTPTTQLTKFITVFFALNGVAILVMLLDQIRRVRTDRARSRLEDADSHASTGASTGQ